MKLTVFYLYEPVNVSMIAYYLAMQIIDTDLLLSVSCTATKREAHADFI